MGRPAKKFFPRQAQLLYRAVLTQACYDALSKNNKKQKADGLDWLLTERSDFVLMSLGVQNLESFRDKLRERLEQSTVTLVFPKDFSKPISFDGLRKAAA
jgi:hypothetical protein